MRLHATERSFVKFYCGNMNHGCYWRNTSRGKVIGVEETRVCAKQRSKFRDEFDRKRNDYTRAVEKVARRFHSRCVKKKQGEDKIEGEEYPFTENDFILVDPPRAGLDEITLDLVREFKDVIYISCDAKFA